ncbi:MAG: hypothetical protein IJF67_03845, partial [Clostridia bacterium]|nr:hypothetical protein [Clostridia bacterium]
MKRLAALLLLLCLPSCGMVREFAAASDVLPVGASVRSAPSAIAHPIEEPPPDTTAAPETTAPPVPEP